MAGIGFQKFIAQADTLAEVQCPRDVGDEGVGAVLIEQAGSVSRFDDAAELGAASNSRTPSVESSSHRRCAGGESGYSPTTATLRTLPTMGALSEHFVSTGASGHLVASRLNRRTS